MENELLACYSSENPVPAVRKKKLRNSSLTEPPSSASPPQAEAPSAKHVSMGPLSAAGAGVEPLTVSVSPPRPGSTSPGSPGSPPQRPPPPVGYGSLGRKPKSQSLLHIPVDGSKTLAHSSPSHTPESKSQRPGSYFSLDRGQKEKPKRPAPMSPGKRSAPSPPSVAPPPVPPGAPPPLPADPPPLPPGGPPPPPPAEVNNNSLPERPMTDGEVKARMTQLLMLDPK